MQAFAGGDSWNMYGVFSKIVPDLPFFAEMPMYRAFPDGRSCLETSHRPPIDLPYWTCFSLNVFVFFLTFSVAVFFPFFDGRLKRVFSSAWEYFLFGLPANNASSVHYSPSLFLFEYLLHSLPSLLFSIKCDRVFLNRTYPQTAYSYVCPTGGLWEVYGRSMGGLWEVSRQDLPSGNALYISISAKKGRSGLILHLLSRQVRMCVHVLPFLHND